MLDWVCWPVHTTVYLFGQGTTGSLSYMVTLTLVLRQVMQGMCSVRYCTHMFFILLYCTEMFFSLVFCADMLFTLLYCPVLSSLVLYFIIKQSITPGVT